MDKEQLINESSKAYRKGYYDCLESVKQLICKNNDKYGYSNRFHEFTVECLKLQSVIQQYNKESEEQ